MAYPIITHGSKFGIHSMQSRGGLPYIEQAQRRGFTLPVAKAVGDIGWLVDVKRIAPKTITVGRLPTGREGLFPNMDEAQNLDYWVDYLFEPILEKFRVAPQLKAAIDYWEICNEPDPPGRDGSQDSSEGYARMGDLMIACMERAEQEGIKLGLLALNAGTPRNWGQMQALVNSGMFARAREGGHILALHEGVFWSHDRQAWDAVDRGMGQKPTGAPAVVNGGGTYCFRYRYLYDLLQKRGEVIPLLISEIRLGFNPFSGDSALVRRNLDWYDQEAAKDSYLLAYLPFTLGSFNDSEWNFAEMREAMPTVMDYIDQQRNRPNNTTNWYGATTPRPDDPGAPPPPAPRPVTETQTTILDQRFALDNQWYDRANVQVWNGWFYWHAEGDSQFGDRQPWNRYAAPEAIHLNRHMLPAHEHAQFLNQWGTCYKVFTDHRAFHARWERPLTLAPGTYRLTMHVWADAYMDWTDAGKTVPTDPKGHRFELYIGPHGRGDWLFPTSLSDNCLTQTVTVPNDGEYRVGFGLMGVWAIKNNGAFLKQFKVERIS